MVVIIKGAGDLASGVALKLYNCGWSVIMTELARPTTIRREVAFSPAITHGSTTVEGVAARRGDSFTEISQIIGEQNIAVTTLDIDALLKQYNPGALVDAVLAKHNTGTSIDDAPIVIALGPGFTAEEDCHAVIETMRGHDLGRVLYNGSAVPDTGTPGDIDGYGSERIVRAPLAGIFTPTAKIGDLVRQGQCIATVDSTPVPAPISGVVRGLLPDKTTVFVGMKSGDIDPRAQVDYCYTVSDKARCIAGGVLEALLHLS